MKTYSAREGDIQRRWVLVDAERKTLGRLATQTAMALRGKHKPIYTPHMDTGDFVIVINAEKVRLTGTKPEQKKYFHHTMYPGGATWTRLTELLAKHPERVVEKAVKGMDAAAGAVAGGIGGRVCGARAQRAQASAAVAARSQQARAFTSNRQIRCEVSFTSRRKSPQSSTNG